MSVIPSAEMRGYIRAEAGRLERLSYRRDIRDQTLAASPSGHPKGLWFDEKAAQYTVKWIEKFCRHHKGEWAGRPLLLESWQKFIVRTLFGWKRPDGTRRYRKAWIEVPRKNGKTELAAAIAMFLLVADREPGAEVYITATKKEQALICHEAARGMVRHSPKLKEHVFVPKAKKSNLVCRDSKMEILASDFGTLDGLSPHGDVRDEVHAWTDHDLAAVLNTAMGSRRQPMTVEITTAGTYDADGVGWQHHEYAVQVLESKFEDDRQFSFVATLDEGDDPWDPKNWIKANPNLGVSLKLDYISEQADEARHNPRLANDFIRLHANRWTRQVERWLNIERWNACDQTPLDLAAYVHALCYVGIDLSRTTDLTAVVFVFIIPQPADKDGHVPEPSIALYPLFFLPQARLDDERGKGERRYTDWAERKLLTVTPGDVVDYAFVRKAIKDTAAKLKNLKEVGFDPYNATQFSTELISDGFKLVEVRQGPPSLSEGCKFLERRTMEKRVLSGGHPILAWCADNAVVRTDANGNIAPDKQRAKSKIDGISATVTGLARYVVAPAAKRSVYETRPSFLSIGPPRG